MSLERLIIYDQKRQLLQSVSLNHIYVNAFAQDVKEPEFR